MHALRIALLSLLAFACGVAAAEPVPCEGRSTGYGSGELVCSLPASAGASQLKFQAHFSGVHDDSSAGLAVALDGKPLACADGSTPRIAGDGGGSALECRLLVPASAAATRKLTVHLLWYHAEPIGYELTRE